MHVKLAERLASSGLKLLQVIKPSTWILRPQWSITVVHIFILLLLLVGFHFHTSWIVLKSSVPARRGLHVYFGLQWGQWDQWGSVGSGGSGNKKCVFHQCFFFFVCVKQKTFLNWIIPQLQIPFLSRQSGTTYFCFWVWGFWSAAAGVMATDKIRRSGW